MGDAFQLGSLNTPRRFSQTIHLIFFTAWLLSCSSGRGGPDKQLTRSATEQIPDEIKQAIEKEFPGPLHYGIAVDSLQNQLSRVGIAAESDYQEQIIQQLALHHSQEILTAKEPLVALTKVVFNEAQRKMTEYAQKVHERHFAYAVVVVGVIINSHYQYDDYLWVEHVSIKDIKRDV